MTCGMPKWRPLPKGAVSRIIALVIARMMVMLEMMRISLVRIRMGRLKWSLARTGAVGERVAGPASIFEVSVMGSGAPRSGVFSEGLAIVRISWFDLGYGYFLKQ
jgi:hypothetical protein